MVMWIPYRPHKRVTWRLCDDTFNLLWGIPMNLRKNFRSILFASSAMALLAACSGAEISSPGEGAFVGTPPGGGGGGGAGGGGMAPAGMDLTFGGCPGGTTADTIPGSDTIACRVIVDPSTGALLGPVTLTASASEPRTYYFEQPTFVGTDDGPTPGALGGTQVTMTIQGGAQVAFTGTTDFLTVNRGSRLVATGSPTAPIVFTSDEDITDDGIANDSQGDARGQWGGLIINGRAPINSCADPSMPATCETQGEGGTGSYGGDNPNDDSGVLNYVRVQYAGFEITTDNELNGIAFQGVGDGTEVDFIQVHNNDDDGVEFFGGTVDVRHVVITGADDDAMDWVSGWSGSAQDILVIGTGIGDNGFEGDSNSSDNNVIPRSNPMVSNFTLIGAPSEDLGMQLRVGTAGVFINGIVTGWEDGCLDIDDQATFDQIDGSATIDQGGTDLQISSVFFTCETAFDDTASDPIDLASTFTGITVGAPADSTLSGPLPGMAEMAIPAIDPTTIGVPEFTRAGEAPETFLGAFEPGVPANATWAFGWTVPGSVFPAGDTCPSHPNVTDITATSNLPAANGASVCEINGTITSDLTLDEFNTFVLRGAVFIGFDQGSDVNNPAGDPSDGENPAIVTVNAGARIIGQSPTDFLVVNRGSQLVANGTASAPIIMTSDEDILGENVGDERGQWGGLIINGRAPINSCADPSQPATCETQGEGGTGSYGGNAPNDNSGVLNYVRVQFAGFEITPDNELNGIAFQGVGDGTEVDFIQVHNNDDDGVEFFGGTVDVSHVVLTGVDDDALDWVSGWDGSAQFVIIAGSGVGDNGFEGDSNSSDNNVLPRSNPTISNWTAIGADSEDLGMQIRVGTAGTFLNGVVTDWDDGCLDIDDQATFDQLNVSTTLTPGVVDLQFVSLFFSCDGGSIVDFTDSNGVVDEPITDIAQLPGITEGTSSLTGGNGFTATVVNGDNENAVAPVDPSTVDPVLVPVQRIGAQSDAGDNWFVGWTVPGSL